MYKEFYFILLLPNILLNFFTSLYKLMTFYLHFVLYSYSSQLQSAGSIPEPEKKSSLLLIILHGACGRDSRMSLTGGTKCLFGRGGHRFDKHGRATRRISDE